MEIEDKIDNTVEHIHSIIDEITIKLDERDRKKVLKENPITEKMNHTLHMLVEKSLMEKLKRESKEQKVSLGEYCRRKLRSEDQLDRIERKIDRLIKK